MEEYILLPKMLNTLDSIDSFYMRLLKKRIPEINKNKFDLEILRSIYLKNENQFYHLLSELKLRGFEFKLKQENNLFHNFAYDGSESFLSVNEDKHNFKKIDFELLGLSSFLEQFHVESDEFFNYIPIKGFTSLNKAIDIENITYMFTENGFNVLKKEDYKESGICPKVDEKNKLKHFSEQNPDDPLKRFFEQLDTKVVNVKLAEMSIKAEYRRFLKKNNLCFLNDILGYSLNDLRKGEGFGEKTIEEVLEIIERYILDGKENNKKFLKDLYPDLLKEKHKKMSIEVLHFKKRIYNSLRNNHIDTIGDLLKYDIQEFYKFRNMGKGSVEEILASLDVFLKNAEGFNGKKNKNEIEREKRIILSEDQLELYKEITVEEFFPDSFRILNLNNINYVIDLNNIKRETLLEYGLSDRQILVIESDLSQKTFGMIIDEISFNENEEKSYYYNKIENQTLEEIGQKLNLSKARIGQILKVVNKKISNGLHKHNFINLVSKITGKQKCITQNEFKKITGSKNDMYIIYFFENKYKELFYLKSMDLFFIKNKIDINHEINELFKILPSVFKVNNYYLEFDSFFEKLELKIYESDVLVILLCNELNYTKYGDFYSIKKLSILEVLDILFKEYITYPLQFGEYAFELCCRLLNEKMEYLVKSDLGTMENAIRACDNILLVGKRTFQHINNIHYNNEGIYLAKEKTEKLRGVKEFVSIKEIFYLDKKKYQEFGIENEYILYSLIRLNYENEFLVGRGVALEICFNKESQGKTIEAKLKEFLKQKEDRECSKQEIMEELNWTERRLLNAINNYENFISSGVNNIRYLEKFKFNKFDKETMEKVIEEEFFEYGILSCKNLLEEKLQFDDRLYRIVKEYKIDNIYVLLKLLKNTFGDLKGHSVVLFKRNSEYSNIKEFVSYKFSDSVFIKKIYDFLKWCGYSENSTNQIINDLIEQKIFVRINLDKLLNIKKLDIPDQISNAVSAWFSSNFKDNKYIVLDNLNDFRDLPFFTYDWNKFTLALVMCENGYRMIRHKGNLMKNKKIILVKASDTIQCFDELVAYSFQFEYDGSNHESEFYNFLVRKGIVEPFANEYEKRLPGEIKNSNIFEVDEIGNIKIKNGVK
jgi:DNA-directed RNA polymerase alpha subunit